MGIVVNVTYKNAILLTLLIIVIISSVKIISKFIPFLNNFISLGAEKINIVEARFDKNINELNTSKNLLFHSLSREGDKQIYSYRIQLNELFDFNDLLKLKPIDYAVYKEDSES